MFKLMSKREWNMRLVIVSLLGTFALMPGYVMADPGAPSELTSYFKSRLDVPLNPEAKMQAIEEDMVGVRKDLDASGAATLGNALAVDMTPLSVNINAATADELSMKWRTRRPASRSGCEM